MRIEVLWEEPRSCFAAVTRAHASRLLQRHKGGAQVKGTGKDQIRRKKVEARWPDCCDGVNPCLARYDSVCRYHQTLRNACSNCALEIWNFVSRARLTSALLSPWPYRCSSK